MEGSEKAPRTEISTTKHTRETSMVALLGGLTLGIALIFAEHYGYGGLFEWTIAFTIGTGFAIAVFWHRRHTRWYWPAVVLLIAIHIAALCLYRWQMLPSKTTGTAIALKGAAGFDFGINALVLYLLHLIIDPGEGSWTHKMNLVIAAIILFHVGLFGVAALVVVYASRH